MGETKETKLCKYCQTEIPKKAKICPNCKKKQRGKLKWIVIAVIVVILIAAIAGGGGDTTPQRVDNTNLPSESNEKQQGTSKTEDKQEETTKTEEEQEEIIFGVGETAELNGVRVTMTDYSESNGSEYNKPSDGNVFLLVEFLIENNTDSELTVSSLVSFEAYADDYALNYSLAAVLEKETSNQLDGQIAAGKKMKGTIGYEVPADWQEVEIHYTDNVWSSSKFKFKITK